MPSGLGFPPETAAGPSEAGKETAMIDGLLGEYLMSYEIKQREAELAHPRMAHRQELARLDAQAARSTGRPSLGTRVWRGVTRVGGVVGARVFTALTQMPPAHDGSVE